MATPINSTLTGDRFSEALIKSRIYSPRSQRSQKRKGKIVFYTLKRLFQNFSFERATSEKGRFAGLSLAKRQSLGKTNRVLQEAQLPLLFRLCG
jgi:hypothetical protein